MKAVVKIVDVAGMKGIRPEYASNLGWFDIDHDPPRIYVDGRLPVVSVAGTRGVIVGHERGHELLWRAGAEAALTPQQRELFCDLFALATAKRAELTDLEMTLRGVLLCGRRWAKKADRAAILASIADVLGAQLDTAKLMEYA